jgi:hypothetical protein
LKNHKKNEKDANRQEKKILSFCSCARTRDHFFSFLLFCSVLPEPKSSEKTEKQKKNFRSAEAMPAPDRA